VLILFSDNCDPELAADCDLVFELEGMNRAAGSANVQNLFDLWTHQEIWEFNKIARTIADRWYFVDDVDTTTSEMGYSAGDCFRFESFQLAIYLRDANVLFHFLNQSQDGKVTIWNPSPSQSQFLEFVINENGWNSRVEIVRNDCHSSAKKETSSRRGVAAKVGREWKRLIANTQMAFQQIAKTRRRATNSRRRIRSAHQPATNESMIDQRLCDPVSIGKTRVFSGADTIGTPRMSGLDDFGFETVRFDSPIDCGTPDKATAQQNAKAFVNLVEKHRVKTQAIVESSDYDKLFSGLPQWMATWWRQHVLLHFPVLAARLEEQSACFRTFLVDEEIALLLMPMAWAGERRMQVSMANKMNIPTVCIQDGLLRAKNESAFSNPVPSRFQIAPGPDGVKWAESHGVEKQHVIDTGQFLWDENESIKKVGGGSTTDSMDLLYLAPRRAFIVDQPAWVIDRQIEWICKSIARNPGIRLFYKDHPRVVEFPGKQWQQEMHARIKSILGDQLVVLPQDKSPESCWATVDAAICYRSTTVFQAISAGVPLILVDFFTPSQDESPYSQVNDEFPVLRTRNELDDCLRKIRNKEMNLLENQDAREKWLRRYFSPAGSIKDVASQLNKIVTENSSVPDRSNTKVA